jgi:hypothetical protein
MPSVKVIAILSDENSMVIGLFMYVFVSVSARAQDGVDPALVIEVHRVEADISQNDQWLKSLAEQIKKNELGAAEIETEKKGLESALSTHSETVNRVKKEITDSLQALPRVERTLSRKASFYRCLSDQLNQVGAVNVDSCRQAHSAKFSDDELHLIEDWKHSVSLTEGEIRSRIAQQTRNLKASEVEKETLSVQLENAKSMSGVLSNRKAELDQRVRVQSQNDTVLKENPGVANCSPGSAELSLENELPFKGASFKGAFFGIPRDNQDGIGSCYANTAKNLLIGLSQGKDNASFLDLALGYKGDTGVVNDGLDGGDSCRTLEKLKVRGYCPQKFAPFETGEKNPYWDGLMGNSSGSVYDQSSMIVLLQKFLEGKETFEKGSPEWSENVISKATLIIDALKGESGIRFPLPGVGIPIPSEWKLNELRYVLKGKGSDFDEKVFQADYDSHYQNFFPKYLKAVLSGKSQAEVFALFKREMNPFIEKYELKDQLPLWERLYTTESGPDFRSPTLQKDLNASLDFMKKITHQESKSTEEFIETCQTPKGGVQPFLLTLAPLIKAMKSRSADLSLLYDSQGKFRSPSDLMQLLVAPSCLNKDNRVKPEFGFSCENGIEFIRNLKKSKQTKEEQTRQLRQKVAASLLQGYPLGNSHQHHINTIVGMRWEPVNQRCEYLIRESQTGTSSWQSEASVFDVIEGLTEVRRK